MIILALETATEACSAALLMDGDSRERFEIAPRGHSELILPMVDELLAEAGISLSRVDGLAFGRGPGAFTGVRIAVGVAQGIAFGADLSVAPVSSLAALAQGMAADQVLAAIDARMGEVYWGAFRRDAEGLMQPGAGECVAAPAQVPAIEGSGWLGAGSGWKSYGEALLGRYPGQVSGHDGAAFPRAASVARLGARVFARGQAVAAEEALPVYLRDQVAWKKQG